MRKLRISSIGIVGLVKTLSTKDKMSQAFDHISMFSSALVENGLVVTDRIRAHLRYDHTTKFIDHATRCFSLLLYSESAQDL